MALAQSSACATLLGEVRSLVSGRITVMMKKLQGCFV